MGIRHALLSAALLMCTAHAAVWYVDVDNTAGPWDGTSWPTAFQTIQEGIDATFGYGGGEVWVAEGVYDEERTSPVHSSLVDTESTVLASGPMAGRARPRDVRTFGHFFSCTPDPWYSCGVHDRTEQGRERICRHTRPTYT